MATPPTTSQNVTAQLVGTRLFGRSLSLVIGFPSDPNLDVKTQFNESNSAGRDISGEDVDFVVEKSLKPTEPNTCAIKVYNLSPTTRQSISGDHPVTVRLEAGYLGGTSQIYFGQARAGWTTREGPNYITHVESTDTIARPNGVRATRTPQPGSNGNIFRTMGGRVPVKEALHQIAEAMGIGEGNLTAALNNLHGAQLSDVNGSALIGNAARRMTDLCRSLGFEWSVQDGTLQLLNIGAALSGTQAILISENTGMEGSPSVDSQGAVSVRTRLIPGLAPGVNVVIDSLFCKGGYRIEKIRYIGSTRGHEWSAHFDAVRY